MNIYSLIKDIDYYLKDIMNLDDFISKLEYAEDKFLLIEGDERTPPTFSQQISKALDIIELIYDIVDSPPVNKSLLREEREKLEFFFHIIHYFKKCRTVYLSL